jgi:hypothetical protein
MANNRFNKQVTPKGYKVGGRVSKMGGGMSTARKDMASGFYKDDMGMRGGAMYNIGGSVKKGPMGSSTTKGNILHGKLKSQKELKKITDSKAYKDASNEDKTEMLNKVTMKKGGRVKKKKQGFKDRKDESIAMRIKKKRTPKQLKDSRDESYGKFGSKAKKSGKINK